MSVLIAKVRRKAVIWSSRRLACRRLDARSGRAIVSFTFDDFPVSAGVRGASVLEERGARGTYYVCLGKLSEQSASGATCAIDDVLRLAANGHEIGCHTYDHADAWEVDRTRFVAGIEQNAARARSLGLPAFRSFAFPKGQATHRVKSALGERFLTLRGNLVGVNGDRTDANLLKANSVYTQQHPIERQRALIEQAVSMGGWLIFYTHDVSDRPSLYGCTPEHLVQIADAVMSAGAEVMTVGDAAARLRQREGSS